MRLFGKISKYTIFSVYALCGLALLMFAIPATGLKAKSVATGSMRPAISAGSLVVIRSTPLSQLMVGDVVTFKNPAKITETITHRIVTVEKKRNVPFFVTKGDANTNNDPEFVGGYVIGRVVAHIPFLGAATDWVKRPLGLVVIIVIPGILVIIDESRRMHRSLMKIEKAKDQTPPDPPAPQGGNRIEAQTVVAAVPDERPKRAMDGMIRRSAIALILVPMVVGVTHAAYRTNTVTLANNRLCVVASHTPSPSPGSISGGTGQGSVNSVTINNSSNTSITNNNNISVFNLNHQWAGSGNVSANNNTTITGNVSSGNASNSNNTSTSVTITNGSPTPTPTPTPSVTPTVTPTPTATPNPTCAP